MENQDRETKLPQWAQNQLRRLRSEVESLNGQLDVIGSGKDSAVIARTMVPEWRMALPDRAEVRFTVNEDGIIGGDRVVSCHINHEQRRLEIRAEGSSPLRLEAVSGNMFYVWIKRYEDENDGERPGTE